MRRKLFILLTIFVCHVTPVMAEDIPADKKILIDKLLAQTGQSAIAVSRQFSSVFIQQMTAVMKQSQPNLDPKAFDYMSEEVSAVIEEEISVKGGFFDLLYPIYHKHFSNNELEQMIAFNKTPLGQKMNQVLPQISQEAMTAGQTFGRALGPKIQQRIITRLEKEGIELDK